MYVHAYAPLEAVKLLFEQVVLLLQQQVPLLGRLQLSALLLHLWMSSSGMCFTRDFIRPQMNSKQLEVRAQTFTTSTTCQRDGGFFAFCTPCA